MRNACQDSLEKIKNREIINRDQGDCPRLEVLAQPPAILQEASLRMDRNSICTTALERVPLIPMGHDQSRPEIRVCR